MTAAPLWLRMRHALCACVASLAVACGTGPQTGLPAGGVQQTAGPVQAPPDSPSDGPVAGSILGRNERFVIYRPGPGDTLMSLAGRFLGSESHDWRIGEFNRIERATPGEPLVVPLTAPNPLGVHPDRVQTVPILCYHRFGPGGGRLSVTPANFALQLDWLHRNRWHVVRLSELMAFMEGRQALPSRSVVITIDDGYESAHRHALPLLRRHAYPATLFVYTDFIGAGDALSWAQLRELVDSGLIDIGAHSKTHRNLVERTAGTTDAQYRRGIDAEVRIPRELLERQLAVPVRHFAFPYGSANETVVDSVGDHRYDAAVSVVPGGNAFYAHPLMLRRTMIFGDHDLSAFAARVQGSRAAGAMPAERP